MLGLGSEARMNTPWRRCGQLGLALSVAGHPSWVASQQRDMAEVYGRPPNAGAMDTAYRQSVLGEGEATDDG